MSKVHGLPKEQRSLVSHRLLWVGHILTSLACRLAGVGAFPAHSVVHRKGLAQPKAHEHCPRGDARVHRKHPLTSERLAAAGAEVPSAAVLVPEATRSTGCHAHQPRSDVVGVP